MDGASGEPAGVSEDVGDVGLRKGDPQGCQFFCKVFAEFLVQIRAVEN